MKKETIAAIALAVAALVILGGLAVFLTVWQVDDIFPSGQTQTQKAADEVLDALHDSQSQEAATALDGALGNPFVIWAGDSRTIGMRDAVDNGDLYIGAAGEGYDWLIESGLPQVKDAIAEYPDAPVVFNFGVNDYDNRDLYMELYISLTEEYPDTHFYFLSVNPIDPAVCTNITNEQIADFNSHLKQLFPETYIDSFTYLMANGAVTIDGIHYSGDDYRAIHEFAVEEIAKTERSFS